MSKTVRVYWPEVARVFGAGAGAALVEEWVEVEVVAELPLRYGDGKTYVVTRGGYFYLLVTGNEYGSRAWQISQFLAKTVADEVGRS